METQTSSPLRWSSKGLLSLLRASLPPVDAATAHPASDMNLQPARLGNDDLYELASRWRGRVSVGDEGADAVADALELVAKHRARARLTRIQFVRERISALMQLT